MEAPESVPNSDGNIREEMVQTAVKFLQNPNVVNTALAQKQRFLQRKGLTDKEIQIACERSGAYQHHESQIVQPPPLPNSLQGPMKPYSYGGQGQITLFDRIRELIHSAAVFSILAYFVHKFYKTYIEPFLFRKKKKTIEESIKELDGNLKASVDELRDGLQSVKVEVDKISNNYSSSTNRQIGELKSEISTVKGLLLSRKQFPSVSNNPVVPPSIPAWQMSSEPHDDHEHDQDVLDRKNEDLLEVGSGSGSSEPEHYTKTSESSLEIIYSSRDCDSESCHSRKSREDVEKDIEKD